MVIIQEAIVLNLESLADLKVTRVLIMLFPNQQHLIWSFQNGKYKTRTTAAPDRHSPVLN